ncbi:hypothetical protein HT031_006437 [Scenedesmus sp. PABB004]|nr:hypothetical protein HT031_006437 [Scenedesmus sp. PABB004]
MPQKLVHLALLVMLALAGPLARGDGWRARALPPLLPRPVRAAVAAAVPAAVPAAGRSAAAPLWAPGGAALIPPGVARAASGDAHAAAARFGWVSVVSDRATDLTWDEGAQAPGLLNQRCSAACAAFGLAPVLVGGGAGAPVPLCRLNRTTTAGAAGQARVEQVFGGWQSGELPWGESSCRGFAADGQPVEARARGWDRLARWPTPGFSCGCCGCLGAGCRRGAAPPEAWAVLTRSGGQVLCGAEVTQLTAAGGLLTPRVLDLTPLDEPSAGWRRSRSRSSARGPPPPREGMSLAAARRALAEALWSPSPGQLSVLDWSSSLFWALLGSISLATCISSTNQRISAEYRRMQLQADKNRLLADMLKLREQAAQQEERLAAAEAALAAGGRWQRWGPLRDRLLAALGS